MKKIEKEIREAMSERTKKFLKQKKCLLSFIRNCIEFPQYVDTFGNPDYKRVLGVLIEDNYPIGTCLSYWVKTPEQWKFWNEIDDCWINRFL